MVICPPSSGPSRSQLSNVQKAQALAWSFAEASPAGYDLKSILAAAMASQGPAYKTRDLSEKTWPDFEKLFSQKNGWDHCWCMHFHRPRGLPANERLHSRPERSVRNRRQKRELVERGCSHGILVYAAGEPVGWCRYGPKEELPRIDNSRKYRGLAPEGDAEKLWRMTCFVVDKEHRRSGVARAALRAALEAIKQDSR